MDTAEAGRMAYKVLKAKYGNNYMKELSKRAAEKRKAKKIEAKLVLDTEASEV